MAIDSGVLSMSQPRFGSAPYSRSQSDNFLERITASLYVGKVVLKQDVLKRGNMNSRKQGRGHLFWLVNIEAIPKEKLQGLYCFALDGSQYIRPAHGYASV